MMAMAGKAKPRVQQPIRRDAFMRTLRKVSRPISTGDASMPKP